MNHYKQVCVLKYRQLLTGLSQSMNISGMRTLFNSVFIVFVSSNCISSCSLSIFNLFRFQLGMCIVSISILKHVFLYRGFVLVDKSSFPLRMVLRVSRIHSKLLFVIHKHPMFSYTCRVSSVQLRLVFRTSAIHFVL